MHGNRRKISLPLVFCSADRFARFYAEKHGYSGTPKPKGKLPLAIRSVGDKIPVLVFDPAVARIQVGVFAVEFLYIGSQNFFNFLP